VLMVTGFVNANH